LCNPSGVFKIPENSIEITQNSLINNRSTVEKVENINEKMRFSKELKDC
jgi:hypothetical protein